MDPLLYHEYSNNRQLDKNDKGKDDFRKRINNIRNLKKKILKIFIKEYSVYFGFNVYGNVTKNGVEKPDNYMIDGELNKKNTHSLFFMEFILMDY